MDDLKELAGQARKISYQNFGKRITFYIPGMFCYNGEWGNYPAISLTGRNCRLNCPHCEGKLLKTMIPARTSQELLRVASDLEKRKVAGFLLTGGFDKSLSLPWSDFAPAIEEIKNKTNLKIIVHCGIVDTKTARVLKKTKIDQALIDVIGDDRTLKKIYKTEMGVQDIFQTIENLIAEDILVVPHIVIGLNYGKITGEYEAIERLKKYKFKTLVFVSLMPLPDTPMEKIEPPDAQKIARIIAWARIQLPDTIMSLGCARKRGDWGIEFWALDCGINRIALPNDETVARAKEYNLKIEWKKTCCSLD
uniref:Radical SAM protein n=1 Tax=candidate division WOR-3 bacterium TaxID=2052148 RepID=A0A7C4XJU5_UNCW3